MKSFCIRTGLLCFFSLIAWGASGASATTTKSVTWTLNEGWDADVSYPVVEGYRAIVGPELSARTDLGKIADPDLPYYRIRVALPADGTFGTATSEVEWEKVDLGGALPLPIAKPVPTGGDIVYPQPGAAYQSVYPAVNVKTEYLQIIQDIRMMPITVTPFRWDGQAKQLYKAKKLTVTATYTVPASRSRLTTSAVSSPSSLNDFQKMAQSMTINPSDATTKSTATPKLTAATARQNLACYGDDAEADYVIISPPLFVDLWKAFADFRKTTENGSSHTFCVVDTTAIYNKYDTVDGDDALKIHRYIEELYALTPRNIKYVVLGAAAKKYQYERDKMIPARYIVCGGSLSQMLDMYYGCMDRMPVGVGVEVWDYDGDGAYLGHKNANGSYSQDSNAYIDWAQDLAVFRFPLMKEVVEAGIRVTSDQIMTNFIHKISRVESESYADRYSAILTGSTGFSTSWRGGVGRTEMYGLITDEREFFDQGLNLFSPEHPSSGSDSEYIPRDHNREFLTSLRGNRKVLMNNSSYSTCPFNEIFSTSGDFLDTVCHGWARGAVGAVNSDNSFRATGIYTIYDCAVPCDTGMYDYCPNGSYGITNCICVGESPILAPNGGALAAINNTRYGWSASWTTSYGLHELGMSGQHSGRLSWLFMEALSGLTSWNQNQGYQPMDAGTALMYAHNQHGTPYASAAWGLSGAQVTGHGDPLARLSIQYERTWNPDGESHEWSTNAANWAIAGKDGKHVFDVSRNVYLPLTEKGSQTFEISNVDSNYFTTAGFFVEQDADATLTLKGNGTFKSLRETVITNGNLRWEVAGGAGRYGVTFVGSTPGNIELPGNNKRYFGEKFVNVGTISVSGGNVVIDTPRNAKFGAGNSLDYEEIEFVATNESDVTEWNQLRSRTPGIFQTDPEKHLRVVNSKLCLQTYNIGGSGSGNWKVPLIYATNSTIKVQANPLWKEEYFVRPTYLHNAQIIGDYDQFAFGPADGTTGYDLYVSGKCAILGDTPIKLNGELRIHFLGDKAELEIANSLCDGTAAGSVSFDGTGTVKISATQNFTNPLTVPNGVTLEGAIANLSTGSIVIQDGASAQFAVIPLEAVKELTLEKGAKVYLPHETANGIYQVVDSAVTTLTDGGAIYYDNSTTPPTLIEGDISEGYLLKTANILFWKGENGRWDTTSTTFWTNSTGVATNYSDGVPLCFADGDASSITVTVAQAVSPGFMNFRNRTSDYVFEGEETISVNTLAIGTAVTFTTPLAVANTLKITTGTAVVNEMSAPTVEIAKDGSLRVQGAMTVPSGVDATNCFVRVKSGGTLVLDGAFYANLSLEAGAILAVDGMSSLTNKQSKTATLSLPESGTVKIDLSQAADTDQKFPILVGYNLTKDDLAKFECTTEEGMLVVKDGDLYAAPKSELPPYTATATVNAKWSELPWMNAKSETFSWNDANRRPNGEVQITANTDVTIDIDVGETIGKLVLKGSGAITFKTSLSDPLTPSAIDDSQHTGTLDWQLPTGSASVTAGLDTCLSGNAAGTGLLTVGANKKVTLGDGVTFANREINKDGWVRFEGTRTDFELAGYTGAHYSFANGSLTGDFTLADHTIRSRSGDYVKFVGSDTNFYARSLVNFDITDGTVEYETNGDTTWFGRSATSGTTPATVFNQSGGTFRCLATGTGAGGGLLVGYEGGNAVGEEIYLNLTGGTFEVPNSYLNFGNPTVVTLLKATHLKAKGYIASMSSGTINLGTNTTDSVVMEVGSLGLNAGAASITMYNGSSIVGFEDGAFIEGGITLRGAKRSSTDEMTIASTNGTTTTLQNLAFEFYVQDGALSAYNGGETVVFGNASMGWDGTIVISSETCLPVNWKVDAGTVSLGAIRYASGSKLKAAPGGIVTFTLSEDEYESGMAIDLIRCDTWVNSYTATQLAEKFRVYRENGTLADGTLSATDGTVTYIPAGGASEYVFPLTATVSEDTTWSSLTWSDRNGKAYDGDWTNVKSAQLINNSGKYTVTMDRSVSLLAMNTQVSANKKLTLADNGDNKLLITSRFNDATSAGTTVVNMNVCQGFAIYAGKDLQLTGSMDTTVNHGTLVIGSSNKATVNNGYWNGDVEMADSTANLYFYSTTAFDRVPCSLNPRSMGKVTYKATINCAGEAVSFGSDSSRATDGRFVISGAMICSDVFVGLGNGSIVGFDVNGGSLTMAKDTPDSQWVLGQDAGSQVTTWIYPGATIDAPDTTLWVGKGGSATLHLGNGISVKGLVNDPDNAANSEVLLYYGKTLLLGAGGINFNSSLSESFYANGTIKVTEDASITVTPAIANAFMTLEAPSNVTMTVNSPIVRSTRESSYPTLDISGGGTIVLNGACSFGGDVNLNAGTLKLATHGLLGNCPAVFKGGKIQVQLSLEEVRAKVNNTYTLYKSADTKENAEKYTSVIVRETGNVVKGVFAKSGDNVTFTPSAGGDITGEIETAGSHSWTNVVWRDATGIVDPSVWESVVGNVILSNKLSSTLTIDKTISLSTLRLYNDGTLTVEGPFTADSVDDSRSTGQTTIGNQGTITSVKAGVDTILESPGSGTLTIENGKKATSRVAFGGTIANSGTYIYDYPVTALSAFTDDRRYTGGGTAGESTYSSGTLKIEKGTYAYSGKFAMTTAKAEISGETQVTTPRFVLGDGSNGNSTFTLAGGTFEVTGSVAPTSNQATILLGHWSSTPTMTISGGMFIATNAVTRLGWDGRPTVTVGGGTEKAVLHVKGIKSGDNGHNGTATFNLKDNGVLELGDSGLQALGSSAAYNFNGGQVVAFADATLKSSTADKMTINNTVTFAAENNKTLTVDADFAGSGTITCGETGKEGTVLFINGTYAETTITGKFTLRMTSAQQSSGAAVTLCKTPSTTDKNNVTVQLSDGSEAPGEIAIEDGAIVWTPPVCKMPLRATATGAVAWNDLAWVDSSDPALEIPKSYWSLLTNISVVVTVEQDAVLTMPPASQKLPDDLSVAGTGTISVENMWPTYEGLTNAAVWQGTLKISNKTGCSGQNFVYLGNSASTVELDNVEGYFNQESVSTDNPCGVTYPYALKISGSGLTIDGGYSEKGFAFTRVLGDGPISFGKSSGDPRMRLVLKDVTNYTGALTVVGNAAVTVGTPSTTISGGKIVIVNGQVAEGQTWTAPNGVEVTGTLTMTPNAVKPFSCAVTFDSGSTLNVAQNEDVCESVPLTTDTLTMDLTNTTLTFNNVAKSGEWTVAAGYLVKTVAIAATTEGFALNAHHNDKILQATGLTGGAIIVGDAFSPVSFATVAGDDVLLKFTGTGRMTLVDGFDASAAAVTIDATGLDGEALAKNAVCGAPYSHWLIKGAVTGTINISDASLPEMPFGYSVSYQVLDDYGVRLIVTAPDFAKFGAISVNIYKDAVLSVEGDHGIYPDAFANWGNLQAAAKATTTVSNATFTIGNAASGYGITTYSDEIYRQYMDDNSTTRTISIDAIPFDQYRVLVYFSTDTGNYQFQPLVVNDGTEDAYYAGETQLQNEANHTVKGRNETWGHSGAYNGMNAINEGVNLLVTDVYTVKNLTLKFTRNGDPRATPCAIQIVKVGEFVDIDPRTLYAKAGTTEFTDETEVLDATGATTTLNSFDTLVITNALTTKFNWTDVEPLEIVIDTPGETVTVNNSDNTGYYAFDGVTVTVSNGTLKLNCGNHGDANIRNTVFNLCEHGELVNTGWFTFEGTVTINSDFDKEVLKNTGNTSSIKGSGELVKGGSGTVTLASKPQGQPIEVNEGTLALLDASTYEVGAITGAGTLDIPAEAVVTVDSIASDTRVSGAGTFVTSGAFPNASNASFQNASCWTGTVWVKSATLGGNNLNVYCNAQSILRFTGVSGWLRNDPADQGIPTLELVDDGETLALEMKDSSSGRLYAFNKLIGSGTFRAATKAGSACAAKFGDVSEFTGALLSTAGTGTTARPIFLGGTATAGSASQITVASGVTVVANGGWQAESVSFGSFLTVKGAEGDTIVSGLASEPVLDTAVTLLDPTTGDPVDGNFMLAYDDETSSVRVVSGGGSAPITVDATWGNLGSAEKGVITNSDGKFGYSPWKVKFSADDQIVSHLKSRYSYVNISSLRLMKRSDNANVPSTVTLSQGDYSVTSAAPTTESNVKAYDTNGAVVVTRAAALYTFSSSVKFDVSKEISLSLDGATGSSVMQPANSVMCYTASGKTWSPILEFTCDEYAARVEPVYLLNYYHADGQQQSGWLNYTQTEGANIPAQTTNDISFAVTCGNGNFKQGVVGTCSPEFSNGAYVDIHGKSHISLLDEIKASSGVDVSQVLKTGLANGADGTATANLSGLTPNQRYVVYFGFGTCGSADPRNGFTLLSGGYGTLDSLDYVVTGAGDNTVQATEYTSFTQGTNIKAANNAMMMVRAVLTPTAEGKVNINLHAGRSSLSFVVVSKISRELTEYTAEVDADTNFEDIVWTPEMPASGFGPDDVLVLTASGTPTLTFTNAYATTATLTINGAVTLAASDELYDDPDVVHKTVASFGRLTAEEYSFATLKNGYKGAYTLTTKSLELHAQTKEVISLNIGGGENKTGTSAADQCVSGTDFVGLIPVQGNTWINQTDRWGGGDVTKDFPSIVATDDGTNTLSKSGMAATCGAYNTFWWTTATDAFLKGYLDDGSQHAQITVTGIPYASYDVIVYAATDSASGGKFTAPTVNGVTYTCGSDGVATAGSSAWGTAKQLTASLGVNAMIVTNHTSSTLTIVGGGNESGNRGGIAAIQIVGTVASSPLVPEDYPAYDDPEQKAAVDAVVTSGVTNQTGAVVVTSEEVVESIKAVSGTSGATPTARQQQVVNTIMLKATDVVEDVSLANGISFDDEGRVVVSIKGENCPLPEGKVTVGYLVLWSCDELTSDDWKPELVTEVPVGGTATVLKTAPDPETPKSFYKSTFQWKKPDLE